MRKLTAILVLAGFAFVPAHTVMRATPASHTYKVADGGGTQPFSTSAAPILVADGGGTQPFSVITTPKA